MMNALTIADLSLSQDLDRDALATILGGAGYEFDSKFVTSGSWGGYNYGGIISKKYNAQGQLIKQKEVYYRYRTQTETSYWNYYYF